MSRYLITCTPAHGHVLPLLQIARHLSRSGHDVVFLTSARYADRVEAAGLQFVALPDEADVDLDDPDTAYPDRAGLTGSAAIRFDIGTLFVRPGAAQLRAVRTILDTMHIDAVLTEPLFVGAALLRRVPRADRPPVVVLGILPLGVRSKDTAPFGLGVRPMPGAIGRIRNAALRLIAEKGIFAGVQREADDMARRAVGRDLGGFILDWAGHADAYVQFTVADFEYPRSDLPASVRFVGPLPPASSATDRELPDWWAELDGARPVVHVTQGTVANSDFAQLVLPTIEALAASDVLVVVTTGGRSRTALPEALPRNVRVGEYLPYDLLLPRVDLMITNGGYGGVQQALSHGIPLVVAGRTEDKIEVAARVAWAGVGVDLRTNTPSPSRIEAAVTRVLSDPSYRDRAQEIGKAIRGSDAWRSLDRVLEQLDRRSEGRGAVSVTDPESAATAETEARNRF